MSLRQHLLGCRRPFLVLCLAIAMNQLISWAGMLVLGRTPIHESHATLAVSELRVWNLNAFQYHGYGRVVGSYPNTGSFTSMSDQPPEWLDHFPYRELTPSNVGERVSTRIVETCGWPLTCCYTLTTIAFDPVSSGRSASVDGGIRLEALGGGNPVRHKRPPSTLPYRPLWKGYIINVSIWFIAVYASGTIWRWRRAGTRSRRGDCVICGYHVATLARCPECGHYVSRRADVSKRIAEGPP